MAKQTDPICGMQNDKDQVAGQSDDNGQTYYFCSIACQRKFEQDPRQYANQSENR